MLWALLWPLRLAMLWAHLPGWSRASQTHGLIHRSCHGKWRTSIHRAMSRSTTNYDWMQEVVYNGTGLPGYQTPPKSLPHNQRPHKYPYFKPHGRFHPMRIRDCHPVMIMYDVYCVCRLSNAAKAVMTRLKMTGRLEARVFVDDTKLGVVDKISWPFVVVAFTGKS